MTKDELDRMPYRSASSAMTCPSGLWMDVYIPLPGFPNRPNDDRVSGITGFSAREPQSGGGLPDTERECLDHRSSPPPGTLS